ncbi:MAG TPA: hypothetical protein VFF27_16150 [Bacteroidia bacterium]|jgi:hypothetical protein|nr:hypothetical protein [Bacteroidia bacterium]
MKKNILYFFLLILFTNPIKANAYRDEFKVLYDEAEQLLLDENYSSALPIYLRLDSLKKGNADINFKIGFCYLNSSTYKTKAIPYLEEATKNITDNYNESKIKVTSAPISAFYYLAKAYHLNYEWDKAVATYEKYISLLGADPKNAKDIEDTRHDIETCNFGKELVKTPLKVIVTNLGANVNSPYPDFSPVVSLDEQTLIFTSRRKGGTTNDTLPNGEYLEDVYVSKYVNGVWEKATPIGPNINTAKHEATINLSADGQKLLLYKDVNGGDIYESELSGSEWGVPVLLSAPVNTSSWEPHACLTSDNRALYFISDRPGGYGGRDIYKCLRLPNGKWGSAQNLGPAINTKYDEDGIFIHPDGKQIYFSSKGHQSMGGFDIFTSKINDENGNWDTPVNYGYPVNTTDDDVFLVTSVDGKRAYFSSDKEGGYGEKDIYIIEFPEFQPRDITVLIGKIVPAPGANINDNEIFIVNTATDDTIQVLNANSTTGKFGANLPVGSSYKTIYRVNGKEFYSEVVDAPKGGGYNVVQRDIEYPGKDARPETKGGKQKEKNEEWFGDKNDDSDTDPASTPKTEEPKTDKDRYAKNKPAEIKPGDVKPADVKPADTNQKENKQPATETTHPKAPDDSKLQPRKEDEIADAPCNMEQLKFELFFRYNQKDISSKKEEFRNFCDNLKACLAANPGMVVDIEASASKVPTRTYRTNERLATARAATAERKIIKALTKRGIKKSDINFVKNELVQGPEYNNDAKSNRATYEQFQYIKIKAYIKK